jgi:thioredoxin-like negative regulator of GroEL
VIERLLAAEAALSRDELDHAQRLYDQVVEADPRNAIAVVGLARVLARRGDTDAARELLAHALDIDPEEAAARRLLGELDAVPEMRAAPEPPQSPGPPPTPVATPRAPESRGLLARLRRLFRLG